MEAIKIFENDRFGEVRVAGTSENPFIFALRMFAGFLEIKNVSDCKFKNWIRGV